ncbi:MAG: hypothetical protein SF066_12225 [Thermoanaerobaculia bacterium]|nr:hypothetical protein [Thermoanaerobaculia bacterium]
MWGPGAVWSALQELWPVLAGLTLLEGVTWLGPRDHLAQGLFGAGLRRRGPGLRWAALGPLDRSHLLPLEWALLGPERVYIRTFAQATGAGRFRLDHHTAVAYSDLLTLLPTLDGSEDDLRFPDGTSVPWPAPPEGSEFGPRIRELARLELAARRRALESALGARFDESALRHRSSALGWPWALLRTSVATAFTGVLLAPFVLYKPGVPVTLAWPLVAGFFALHLGTAVAGELTQRRLVNQHLPTPRGARLGLWLYPPANLRAVTTLSKHLAWDLDLLAVLAAEGAPGELEAALASEFHGIAMALADPAGDDDWRAAWSLRRAALEALMARLGLDRDRLLAPPERSDPQASHYCPFCDGEFLPGPTECPACRATLRPLAPAQPTGTKQPRSRRKSPKL